MKLLIVESPGKIKKIRSFLGTGWAVMASVGHVRDLPKKELGVRIGTDKVALRYVNNPDKERTIKQLKTAADSSEEIFLAMDMDREGEAIAWHVGMLLEEPNWPKIKRIAFTEITKKAVLDAVANPRRVDANLVNAQQARRAVDRLVGFKVSPVVWAARNAGSSAGRVQSVAVRLVVEREREIRNFKPHEYWKIKAKLSPQDKADAAFWAELQKLDGKDVVSKIEAAEATKQIVIPSQAEATKLVDEFKAGTWTVSSLTQKTQEKSPFPPYITSTLQQAASVRLKWGAQKTMLVAQSLYESHGAITYMRTDSPAISDEAVKMARDYIAKNFAPPYLPAKPNVYKAKATNAQEAHECIRPTHVEHTPQNIEGLNDDEQRLYKLIWTQFVACQMSSARFHVTTIDVEAAPASVPAGRDAGPTGLFRARGRQMLFDGWTKLTGSSSQTTKDKEGGDWDEEDQDAALLPEVAQGQPLKLHEIKPSQHKTQAPSRYTEATLIRAMEKMGIGRPSTYAAIMENIRRRGYIREQKRVFYAQPVGESLVNLLMRHFKQTWMEYQFTAHMEEDLDKVAEGQLNWHQIVLAFNAQLEQVTSRFPARQPAQAGAEQTPKPPPEPTDEKCDKCGAAMVIRAGRNGRFMACTAFPVCRNAKPAPGEPVGPPCEKCGKPMIRRTGRRGDFWGCSGYPDCRNIKDIPQTSAETGGAADVKPPSTGEPKAKS
ncbi:MAG TPA: type I DNA topoisomerase [Planctomycetota bacterium]